MWRIQKSIQEKSRNIIKYDPTRKSGDFLGNMKYGITTHYFKKFVTSDEMLYKGIKNVVYDYVDYSMYDKMFVQNPIFSKSTKEWQNHFKNQRKIIEGEGLEVSQVHCIFPPDFSDPVTHVRDYVNDYELDYYKKELESANILGAPFAVVHHLANGYLSADDKKSITFEKNVVFYSKILPTAREFGVKIAIEDLFARDSSSPFGYKKSHIGTADEMVEFIDLMCDDHIVGCLDVGHMNMFDVPCDKAVRTLGNRLKVLHLHDNYGRADLHLPPLYGNIDWLALKNALDDIGYNGVYSMELDGIARGVGVNEKIIFTEARQALEIIKDLWK